MAGVAPQVGLRAVLLCEVVRPEDFAGVGVEGKEVALGAERVDFAVGDGGRAARTGRIGDRVLDRVLVLPEFLAGRLVETEHAFDAGGFLALEIGDVDVVARSRSR